MYADEAAFKHNTRAQSDAERVASAMQGVSGSRLSWFASEAERPSTP